ncbi:MAG: hypothetical protein IJO29_01730 [Oscillospiraceae bacterium]|nr:hypothetical protein [Oscillospiraceae bacterium]
MKKVLLAVALTITGASSLFFLIMFIVMLVSGDSAGSIIALFFVLLFGILFALLLREYRYGKRNSTIKINNKQDLEIQNISNITITNNYNEYDEYAFGLRKKSSYTRNEAEILAPQLLKQVQDCVNLINTTVQPDVFFKRYGMAIYRLNELSKMEKVIKFTGINPSIFIQTMINEKQSAIKLLIDRMYEKTKEKLSSLKTDKAIMHNISVFIVELVPFENQMSQETLAYKMQKDEFLKTEYLPQYRCKEPDGILDIHQHYKSVDKVCSVCGMTLANNDCKCQYCGTVCR